MVLRWEGAVQGARSATETAPSHRGKNVGVLNSMLREVFGWRCIARQPFGTPIPRESIWRTATAVYLQPEQLLVGVHVTVQ